MPDDFRHILVPGTTENWIEIWCDLLDLATGTHAAWLEHGLFDDETQECSTSIWEDGNFSCDCNRALFFHRAVGDDLDGTQYPCGDDGYAVRLSAPATGRVIYQELAWQEVLPHDPQ